MFYKVTDDKEEVELIKDKGNSTQHGKTKDGKESQLEQDIVAYNIITTSDKEINGRIYPDTSVKITVLEDRWVQTFPKPFLINHDIYCEANGRVCDSVYVLHTNKSQIGGKETVPDEVINYFDNKKCFKDGTGSVIGKIMCTKDTVEKIKSSVIYTTSQSSSTDKYTCNICGCNYYDGCSHIAGKTYEVDGVNKICVPRTGELFPIENSSVNQPANDSSIIVLYDTKNKKIILNSIDKQFMQSANNEDFNVEFDNIIKTQDNNANEEQKPNLKQEDNKKMTEKEMQDKLAIIKTHDTNEFTKLTSFMEDGVKKECLDIFGKLDDAALQQVNAIISKVIATNDTKEKEFNEKLKVAEDKLAEVEGKLKVAEDKLAEVEPTVPDKQEDTTKPVAPTEDQTPANPKATVVPAEKSTKDEEEEEQEEPSDIYASFTITPKKKKK